MYMFACFWSLQMQLGPSEIASQSHSSKIEPNHFVFACAPRIGSGALALPMSGMIPKQGNKRSNRNTQPVATGVAEATKGDAKPQGKEAAPPSQGPAVPPEAETSQEAAPSQAQAETSASAEPSGAQAAEQPSAENGSTPKRLRPRSLAAPVRDRCTLRRRCRRETKEKVRANRTRRPLGLFHNLPYHFHGGRTHMVIGGTLTGTTGGWVTGHRAVDNLGRSPREHLRPAPVGRSSLEGLGCIRVARSMDSHPKNQSVRPQARRPPRRRRRSLRSPEVERRRRTNSQERRATRSRSRRRQPKDEPPDGDDDPDWGGDDDGGDGDSDYTYEYEEEGEEEEFAKEDQSLVVTPRSERPSVQRQGSAPKAKAAPRPEPKAKAKAKAGNRPRQEVPPERSPRDRTGSAATLLAAASDLSSIRTESVRELLRNRSSDGDRSRPNIGNVKLETFRGDRNHYKDWIKIIQAQRRLYQLRDGELAVLIFLSCEGEARQVLNQLEVDDMQSEGGLGRMLRLLDDAFGSKADERFEERQGAYLGYKRLPGQSIAAYVATLKRLREEYLKEDTGTTISDKAFAQRLLQRAGLTRRERYDVFFAAGGAYKSAEIERVLRFRCAHVHKEEHGGSRGARRDEPERASASAASRRPQQAKRYPYKRGDRRKPPKPTRYAHVADNDDEVEEDPFDEDDDEDFENEDPEMEALVAEGEMPEEEEWSEEDEDLETMDEQALTEAFTAGWRAKQRTADARKSRGFKPKGKGAGKGGGDRRTPEDRKRNSTCASCGEKGPLERRPGVQECAIGQGPSSQEGEWQLLRPQQQEQGGQRGDAGWGDATTQGSALDSQAAGAGGATPWAPTVGPPTTCGATGGDSQRCTSDTAEARRGREVQGEGQPGQAEAEDNPAGRNCKEQDSTGVRCRPSSAAPISPWGRRQGSLKKKEKAEVTRRTWRRSWWDSSINSKDGTFRGRVESPCRRRWRPQHPPGELDPGAWMEFSQGVWIEFRSSDMGVRGWVERGAGCGGTVQAPGSGEQARGQDEAQGQVVDGPEVSGGWRGGWTAAAAYPQEGEEGARAVGSSHSIGLWPRQVQVKATIKAWQRCGIRAGWGDGTECPRTLEDPPIHEQGREEDVVQAVEEGEGGWDPQGLRQGCTSRQDTLDDEATGSTTRWLLCGSSPIISGSSQLEPRSR